MRIQKTPLLFLVQALLMVLLLSSAFMVSADPYPPTLGNGAAHFPAVAWPAEPSDPTQCGTTCGDWLPYTRFQSGVADPRVQDPSNGGTSPQNYVNISSSCTDKSKPSIYYALRQGAAADGSDDVILFRWRVEQIANTYATGPSAGNYGATDPWNSALWSVLFDVNGDGFLDLAAHLDGSSGAPSVAVDRIAGIWSKLPTQSLDYLGDPANVKLIAHNPTAYVDSNGSNRILNFQNALNPVPSWPNGSSETNWDYGTTRSKLVTNSPCNEYFIDYQIPVKMLDASSLGGPKITRSSPISMVFCTANSLNNPFQKDCAINAGWVGAAGQPAPFGDYISFNQSQPYAQPIVASVTATAPSTCPGSYTLSTEVQDTLAIVNGKVAPSVKGVKFFYYYDVNGDGVANDGSSWTFAADAARNPGSYTTWTASWSGASLLKGSYLIGVQAVDDNTVVDLGVTPSGVDNRTFSYVTGDASNRIYVGGTSYASLPAHSPTQSPSASENWYGNPAVTGSQVALVGLALNTCGVAPTLSKSASLTNMAAGGTLSYTLTLNNTTGAAIAATQISDSLPSGFSYQSTTSVTNGGSTVTPSSSPTLNATGAVAWNFNALSIANNSSLVLTFVAKAGSAAGTYNNIATSTTSFGTLTSSPVTVQVDSARVSLSKTPSTYSINPDGSTQLTYTLAYSNDSAVSVTGASISDSLPAGVSFVSCSNSCSNSSGTLTWTLGTLAGGASGSVTVAVTVNTNYASTSLTNSATLSATAPDSTTVTKSATAVVAVNIVAPAFSLSKSANVSAVAPGANVTWTMAYNNYGSGAASGVVLSDPLPAGFTYVSSSPTASTAPAVGANGTVSWSLGSVAAAATGSVQVTAKAASPYTGYSNPTTNTATLSWTGGTPVSASNEVGVSLSGSTCINYYLQGTSTSVGTLTGNLVGTSTALSGNQYTASTLTPSGSTSTVSTTVAASGSPVETEIARFYQDPISSQLITFNGSSTLTGQIYYTKANVANANLTMYAKVYDYNPSTGTQTLIGSTSYVDNGSPTPPISLSSVTPSGSLAKGHRLLIVVSALLANNKGSTISVNVNDTRSYVQLCAPAPANLVLQKSVNASTVTLTGTGRTLTYTLNYANTSGSTAATSVVLSDPLPAGTTFVSASATPAATSVTPPSVGSNGTVTWNFSSLAAGASGSTSVVVNVPDNLSGASSIVNTASLSSTETAAVNASASTQVVGGTGSPSLSLSKAASKTSLLAGDSVTYTLTVVNTGTAAASSVSVSDVLPATIYFTYGSCTTATGSCSQSGGTLSWTVGTLAAGASASLTFTMNVGATGVPAGVTPLNNTATATDSSYCTGGSPPASCTSNTVTVSVSGNPNVSISKTASPASVAPGGLVTYTLTVSNSGSAAATGVIVNDPVPAHLSFKAITSAGSGTGSFDAVNNQVVFNVGTLAAGASTTLSFTATVGSLASGTTTLTNTASATASNAPSKTAVATNSANAAPVMTLSKSGPASLPFPAATLTAAASASTNVFVNSASLLEVGDWVQVVNGSGNPVLQITAISGNVLTLGSAVTASSGTALRKAGVWSLAYQNTGNADASSVVVTDPLPASWIYVGSSPAASSAPSVGSNGTVSWSLGTVAAAASGTLQLWAVPTVTGSTTNTATLTATGLANVSSSASVATGGLVVSKATTTPTSSAGGTAHYVISISNSLGSPASGLTVTDALPTGFSYKTATALVGGSAVEPGFDASDAIHNQPVWSGVSVPANSTLTIAFDANIDASVGAATYQNAVTLGNVPAGVASVPFDPLGTTAEDVTVLAANTGIVQGYVYRDGNTNGSYDAGSDPTYAGVGVSIVVGGTTYTVATDGNGFFSRVVPAGSATVTVDTTALPAGLQLTTGNANPGTVTVSSGAVSQKDTGFVVVAPVLAVSKSHTGNFVAGGSGSYTVTVSNSGGAATSGTVTLTDSAPSGMTVTAMSGSGWSCSSLPSCTRTDALAAGSSYPAITVTVSISAGASSPLVNSVTASGGGSASATATDSTIIAQAPAWQITKTHSGSMTAGGTGSYTVTVSNSGGSASAASTVTVTDTPPTGMTVTGMSGTGWTCANNSGWACTRSDSLAANASYPTVLVTVSIASNASTPLVNSTTVSGGGVASSATATDSTTIVQPPAFKIEKAATASVLTGGSITYTITLTNIGGSTSGTSATVKDVLPAGVSVTGVTPGTGVSTVNCANYTSPFTCTVTLSAGLAVNVTASFSYTATAPNTAGAITNYMGVDPSGGNSPPTDPTTTCSPTTACASASTNVTSAAQPAAWAITKTHSGSMTAGGTGSYTVTVSNSGGSASAASTVTVTDTPPTGMTVTGMSGTGWTCANNSGWACTRSDSLTANASYPTLLVSVSIASNASTPLVNSTTVSGGGVASSATATDSTNITPPAATFGIAKAATSSVAAGGSITYTITLSNIGGNTSGTSATVKDVLPAGVTVTAVTPGSGVNSVSCGANFNSPMVCTVTLSSGLAVNGTASFSYTATAPNTTGAITNYIGVDPSGGSSPPTDPTTTCTPTTACASASTTVIGPDVYTTISAPSSVANGAVANLVLSFGNQGAVAAQGVTYQLTLPTTVTGVSCGAASCAFNAATGVLTLTGLPTTLVVGQQVSVNVSYRAPVTGNTALSATSLIATTTPGEAPSNNNSANAVTNITAAATQPDPTTSLRAPATSYPGSAVAVDISYTNLGADNAQGLGFAVSGFPNTGTPAFSYNGIVCTWNQATGAVTGCGLPSTLPVGQSISLRASYTAPSSGSVTLTSTVSSTSVDANNSNNTATAVTTVVSQPPTPVADVTTSVSVPGQAYGGSTVLVPLVFQNLGPASAISVSYAVSLTGGASNLQVSNNGVLCTYSGGSISGCNLPGTLAAGQAVNLVLSFTAPAAPASMTVTSTVSTSTVESNAGNNSATGSLSVPTLQPTGTISGRVWYDANRNRRYDSGEVGRANWSVDLLQGGSPIARTSTDANGQYSFTGLADGVYAVRFMPWMGSGTLPVNGESGTAITGGGIPGQSILDNIVIANVGTRNFRLKIGGDVVTEQSLPIDPSGTVYDSSTRQPIAGATVTLGYACGSVDSSWLAGSSSVTTGADGSYAFFLLPAAPSACNYTLTVSKTGYTSPSTVIPSSGSWPAGGGAVTGVSGAPSGGQATTYYLSGPKPTTDVTNNNIPLDPQAVVPGAAPASVPTLSTWALLLLMTGLAALAAPRMARRPRAGGG